MSLFHIKNIKVAGIATCVPPTVDKNRENPYMTAEEAEKFIASTGVVEKRVADKDTTSADLCQQAAEQLMSDMNIDRAEIECLFFVSQTPDYILPATSCILQDRLGLPQECTTIDISLGCSGWVYGLSAMSALMSASGMKKGLLLVGDTTLKLGVPQDKSYWPLFGDAGSATLLERDEDGKGLFFHTATDGSGFEAILLPDGGYRNMPTEESLKLKEAENGNFRTAMNTKMEGMDVFAFAISKVPKSIKKVVELASENIEAVDYFVLHQANRLINDTIRKKLKIAPEKFPFSLEKFGNSSCASIPQTMCYAMQEALQERRLKVVACGFGVGLSWASAYFETDHIYCSPMLDYHK